MPRPVDDEIRQLHDDVRRRQFYTKGPQPIAETLSVLLARRGYAFVEAAAERDEAWGAIVGDTMAQYSRMGNIRRGVLEVTVCNSAVLQELTFQKKQLLEKIVVALPDQKICDVRFRIGVVR
jgi:predicted nucleic acid-binding Zn ribbon protein